MIDYLTGEADWDILVGSEDGEKGREKGGGGVSFLPVRRQMDYLAG